MERELIASRSILAATFRNQVPVRFNHIVYVRQGINHTVRAVPFLNAFFKLLAFLTYHREFSQILNYLRKSIKLVAQNITQLQQWLCQRSKMCIVSAYLYDITINKINLNHVHLTNFSTKMIVYKHIVDISAYCSNNDKPINLNLKLTRTQYL